MGGSKIPDYPSYGRSFIKKVKLKFHGTVPMNVLLGILINHMMPGYIVFKTNKKHASKSSKIKLPIIIAQQETSITVTAGDRINVTEN